jgi:hypothetical protein
MDVAREPGGPCNVLVRSGRRSANYQPSVGLGAGDFGAGKLGGIPEIVARGKAGEEWKFIADAPVVIAAWFRFLAAKGGVSPSGLYTVCNMQIHP